MSKIQADTTNHSAVIRVYNPTNGVPLETVVGSNLTAYHARMNATLIAIAVTDLATLTEAHTNGGFFHIDDGYYRLDVPDAAYATGASQVVVGGNVTGMVVIGDMWEIVTNDPNPLVESAATVAAAVRVEMDSNSVELASLVVAAASNVVANASLIASQAVIQSQTTLISTIAGTAIATAVWEHASRVNTGSTNLTELNSLVAAIITDAAGTNVSADIAAAKTQLDVVQADTTVIETFVTAFASIIAKQDVIQADTTLIAALENVSAGAVWDQARTSNVTAGSFGEGYAGVVNGAAATGTLSVTQMSTDLSEATDDHYIGRTVVWITGPLAGQASDVTDYVGVNGVLTFTAVTDVPANGNRFVLV